MDDDPERASLLAFALQRQGYVVEVAANGSDVLQRVRRARFDVVVVDRTMPVMDGAGLLRAYRREAGTSALPVVVMSGAPEAVTQALRLGAAAVVAKPFCFGERPLRPRRYRAGHHRSLVHVQAAAARVDDVHGPDQAGDEKRVAALAARRGTRTACS